MAVAMTTVKNVGYGAVSATSVMAPVKYTIREPLDEEVLIEVAYCGICHSDIHTARSEWYKTPYPCVPGHEFTGLVSKVGSKVTKHKVGDRVAVGCVVKACFDCNRCEKDLENYCKKMIGTYSATDECGQLTYGGYGKFVVAHERCVLKLPEALPIDRSAPLLCAGITVYSPIQHYGVARGGYRVGVIGLGGLGHMAVQFAAKFNNDVVVLARNDKKKELSMKLGAKEFIHTEEEYAAAAETLDFIIDTVSADKPMGKYLNLLNLDGTLIVVGVPPTDSPPKIDSMGLIMRRRRIVGSCIGGMKETQEMLEFCAKNEILPYVEFIKSDYIPEAYERVLKSDVMFRFVIDVKGSQLSAE